MSLFAKQKGKRGEDLFCKWLKENLNIDARREHFQADGHSTDVQTEHFLFEVKNRETHSFDDYWLQVLNAQRKHKIPDLIPIVAFKSNRQKWQFMIPANLITGVDRGYVIATERVFIQLAQYIIGE